MTKRIIAIYIILGLTSAFIFSAAVAAKPDFWVVDVHNPVTQEIKNSVAVPAQAVEKAPGLYYLGQATDLTGKLVEGYAILKFKDNLAKPGTVCGNGVCEPGENARKCPQDCGGSQEPDASSCYSFLAKDTKWKMVESWVVNPETQDLDPSSVFDLLDNSIVKWETAANFNIVGNGSQTVEELAADTVSPDGVNEVYFADIEQPGAIGITIVWGVFGGPPMNRELVEWDQVYDDTDFDWSDSGEAGKMDFENIATHELGHSVGMGDLYTTECAEQTMYGYADYGEINKRTLEAGDIAGIYKLYN